MLRARSHPAAFPRGRKGVDIEIRIRIHKGRGLAGLVIAEAGPERGLAEHGGIHVEKRALKFTVGPGIVSIVSQLQDDFRDAGSGP